MGNSSELQFGALREVWRHARGREHCRGESGSSLLGGYAPGSAKTEGSSIVDERTRGGLNPCAQETKARIGRFVREKLMSDHGLFSSYEGPNERRTGKIRGACSKIHTALDGWMLARAPASPAQGLHHHGPRYFNFPYFCTMCGLEKLGLVDQN